MESPSAATSELCESQAENLRLVTEIAENIRNAVMGRPDESATDMNNEERLENFYRVFLRQKLPTGALETVQLRYIPDYIRELRNQKDYWGTEYRRWKDLMALENWRTYEKKLKEEIAKQKTMLWYLDGMKLLSAPDSENKSHFSESLDAERVQALVTRIKEHDKDETIFEVIQQEGDLYNTYYGIYAVCALYGEFRIRPWRSNVRNKEEN